MDRVVIVIGNDHTNTLGIVQVLGRSGNVMRAYLWGAKTGFVKSSNYIDKVYSAKDEQACVELILKNEAAPGVRIPIIATCDSAALVLERNKTDLTPFFIFEYSKTYSIEHLLSKEYQVKYAMAAGFNVPRTWTLEDGSPIIPEDLLFPCLIKPQISSQGAKVDIRICKSIKDLKINLKTLKHTKRVIIQQYIERDYEISILGVGLKTGEVIIPCVENKLTLYPKNVGLECLANMQPLEDDKIIRPIKNLIKDIGYVGPFSVEMMHCRLDNRFYFTEINLRNDGANSLVYKFGVNLPLNHIEDLLDLPITKFDSFAPGYYIWDMHHFLSLVHRELSFLQWLSDLKKSKGFMTYFHDDKKPFFKQYTNWLLSKLCIIKDKYYE